MDQNDDTNPVLTDADRDSETRFGTRPVPENHRRPEEWATDLGRGPTDLGGMPHRGQRIAAQKPLVRNSARTIQKSPFGSPRKRDQRSHSSDLSARLVVWGGLALGIAGLTSATVLGIRKVASMINDSDETPSIRQGSHSQDRPTLAPRFAEMQEDERENMRRRVREQARSDQRDMAARRSSARPSLKGDSGRNIAQAVTETADQVASSIDKVSKSLVSAFEGFETVASKATVIVNEFAQAADQVRSVVSGAGGAPSSHKASRPADTSSRGESRTHRL